MSVILQYSVVCTLIDDVITSDDVIKCSKLQSGTESVASTQRSKKHTVELPVSDHH